MGLGAVAVPLGGHMPHPPALGKINFAFRLNQMIKCWGRGNILATYFL